MIINLDLLEWRRKVFQLHEAEYKAEKYYTEGKITKKEMYRIKKIMKQLWINNWTDCPLRDNSFEQAFKLNFS
jgi:hypothetical protein